MVLSNLTTLSSLALEAVALYLQEELSLLLRRLQVLQVRALRLLRLVVLVDSCCLVCSQPDVAKLSFSGWGY
jgi:hypothetical protein